MLSHLQSLLQMNPCQFDIIRPRKRDPVVSSKPGIVRCIFDRFRKVINRIGELIRFGLNYSEPVMGLGLKTVDLQDLPKVLACSSCIALLQKLFRRVKVLCDHLVLMTLLSGRALCSFFSAGS